MSEENNLSVRETPHFGRVENPLFGYTHLLPSPFTPPSGRLQIGLTSGVGVTNSLSLETNLLSDFYKIFNARMRYALLDFPGFALGLSIGFQYVNLNSIAPTNPSLGLIGWMPGGVMGVEIAPHVALFTGGHFFYANMDVTQLNISNSGFVQGTEIESDLSWAYHPQKKGVGNVMSLGATYNTTFRFYGVGFSHHWKGFQLGAHFYPNAAHMRFLPIFSGGAVVEL